MNNDRKLKIQTIQAIDVAKPVNNSENLLIVKDVDILKDIPFINTEEIKSSDITSLYESFGLDHRFYYKIDLIESKETPNIICSELGTGFLVSHDNELFLHRSQPVSFIEPDKDPTPIKSPQSQIHFCAEDNLLLITSLFPDNIFDCIGDPHSIIYSNEFFKANPLFVDNESLIGRLKEDITSIPITYIVNEVVKKIQSITKKIVLKTKQLYLNQLVLQDYDKAEDIEGSIIYDKKEKCLKLFNGKDWVKV